MSSIQPLVSVIMPAYNAEKFIAESIESILNQSYSNWELIVINDGSTDQTKSIVSNFLSDDRIQLINHEYNQGLIISRNSGIEAANGKYIANLDSDDIALPLRLQKQVNFLENNINYVLLGSACVNIDAKGSQINTTRREIPNLALKSILLFSNYFINSSVMMKTEIAKKVSYDSSIPLAEDYYYFVELSQYGDIGNLSETLIKYRIHDNNISKVKEKELKNATQLIFKKQLEKLSVDSTAKELSIHSSIVDASFKNFGFTLTDVEVWLKKLVHSNEKNSVYPTSIFNYYCSFFYRRCCTRNSGISSIREFRKSSLSKFLRKDIKGNSIFFVKSILNLQ